MKEIPIVTDDEAGICNAIDLYLRCWNLKELKNLESKWSRPFF